MSAEHWHTFKTSPGEQRNKNSEIISKNFRRFLIILQRYLPSILNCGSIHHHRVNREIKDQKLFPKVFKRGILMGIRLQGYLQLGLNCGFKKRMRKLSCKIFWNYFVFSYSVNTNKLISLSVYMSTLESCHFCIRFFSTQIWIT